MDDELANGADVYRPKTKEPVPVIMTSGPYGKGARYQEHYKPMWDWLVAQHPEFFPARHEVLTLGDGRSRDMGAMGLCVIRVDSRGAGRSPGYLDIFSPRETRDYSMRSNGPALGLGQTARSV